MYYECIISSIDQETESIVALKGLFTKKIIPLQSHLNLDLGSRCHETLTQSLAPRVEVQAAASRGPMWRRELKPLGTKLKPNFVYKLRGL